MSKILEKSLKDARKEHKLTMGAKQVLTDLNNSKLIILSRSLDSTMLEKIQSDAKKQKVPLVKFEGTSVALGRFCLLYTSPSPRDRQKSRMPSSA